MIDAVHVGWNTDEDNTSRGRGGWAVASYSTVLVHCGIFYHLLWNTWCSPFPQPSYWPIQSTSSSHCGSSGAHYYMGWLLALGYRWRFIINSWTRLFLFLSWLVGPYAAERQDWLFACEILSLDSFLCRLPFSFTYNDCFILYASSAQVYLHRWEEQRPGTWPNVLR